MTSTHEVFNQPPELAGYDVAADPAMLDALRREGAGWAEDGLRELGRLAGSAQAQEWGRQANEHPPVLRTHDRFGNRIDEVEFHPAWHSLMTVAVGHGLHATPWRDSRPGAHVARAAGWPLPRPSARSARPSRCSPRVRTASAATARPAAVSGPAPSG